MNNIPQYSDIEISFEDIKYNLDPTDIDLDAVDDIIVVVAGKNANQFFPIATLTKLLNSDRFTINNTDKSVLVKFIASEIGNSTGDYYVNLWIVLNGRHVTHLTKTFTIVDTINYD